MPDPYSEYCVPVHLDDQKPSDVTAAHARAFARRQAEAIALRREKEKVGSSMSKMRTRRR